ERRTNILASLEQIIERQGRVLSRHDWGLRPTAYEVRKRGDADYHLIHSEGTPERLNQLDHALKITDGVNRFRIIKLRKGTPPPPDLHMSAAAAVAEQPAPEIERQRRAPPRAAATNPSINPPNLRPSQGMRRAHP